MHALIYILRNIWEHPKESTKRKLLEIINEFSKVADQYTTIVTVHTSNEQSKSEIKTVLLTIALKGIKYIWNLMGEMNNFYTESYKTFLNEIEYIPK